MAMTLKSPPKLGGGVVHPPHLFLTLHHVLLYYSDEPLLTQHEKRHSVVRVHAPSHRAVGGALHDHQGQEHVAGGFHLLLRPYYPSPCRGRPEPFACCAQGG